MLDNSTFLWVAYVVFWYQACIITCIDMMASYDPIHTLNTRAFYFPFKMIWKWFVLLNLFSYFIIAQNV